MDNLLDILALKYGTDKSSSGHGYTAQYNKYFNSYQDKDFKLLEIGVYDGSSINLWKEYFSKASLTAIDIDPRCLIHNSDRINIEIGDQTNEIFLRSISEKHGPFDIIIDDGGHSNKQQITSFETLFPLLNPFGLYIIEDLHCSYIKNSQWDDYHISTTEYLKYLIDKINLYGKSFIGYKEIGNADLDYLEKNIEFIHFYKSICIIQKKAEPL
jgi:hypothetical protein